MRRLKFTGGVVTICVLVEMVLLLLWIFYLALQGEDFEEFIDVDQDNRLTDSEVIELLKQQLGGKSLEEFSSEEQKRILKTMKQSPGVKNRQLARITGVGFNIIRRL